MLRGIADRDEHLGATIYGFGRGHSQLRFGLGTPLTLPGAIPRGTSSYRQLRTERIKNRCVIKARVGFRLLPVPRDILRKCGGSSLEK